VSDVDVSLKATFLNTFVRAKIAFENFGFLSVRVLSFEVFFEKSSAEEKLSASSVTALEGDFLVLSFDVVVQVSLTIQLYRTVNALLPFSDLFNILVFLSDVLKSLLLRFKEGGTLELALDGHVLVESRHVHCQLRTAAAVPERKKVLKVKKCLGQPLQCSERDFSKVDLNFYFSIFSPKKLLSKKSDNCVNAFRPT